MGLLGDVQHDPRLDGDHQFMGLHPIQNDPHLGGGLNASAHNVSVGRPSFGGGVGEDKEFDFDHENF